MLGWLNASLKSTETREELSTNYTIQKLCRDASQRLMLHLYITTSRTIIYILLS